MRQRQVLQALLAPVPLRPVATIELHRAIYGFAATTPSVTQVYQELRRLGEKLAPLGVEITNWQSMGYRIQAVHSACTVAA